MRVQFAPHFVALNKKSIRFGRLHNSLNVRSERSSAMNDVMKMFNWRVLVMLSKNVQF